MSASLFVYCLDQELKRLDALWAKKGLGWTHKHDTLNDIISETDAANPLKPTDALRALVWADDIHVCAESPEMLKKMLSSMTLRFQTIGLYTQEAKTVWTSTNKAHMSESIRIFGNPLQCTDPEHGLPMYPGITRSHSCAVLAATMITVSPLHGKLSGSYLVCSWTTPSI